MSVPIKSALQQGVPVAISAPNMQVVTFGIEGTAPYVQHRFPAKAMLAMKAKMEAGPTAKGKKQREARDFDAELTNAQHFSEAEWVGIPASAFRQGMISACRLVGFKMTLAKLSVFVEADGIDKVDGIPLIRLKAEAPERSELPVRLPNNSVDIRVRPMWRKWGATVRVCYDADQFTLTDVTNLMMRVGSQVGIGEGRPDSSASAGAGWGTFRLLGA